MMSLRHIELLKQHEGYRSKAYKDTVGILTVGYGTNLESRKFTEAECAKWMLEDLKSIENELQTTVLPFAMLDHPVRRDVLIEMGYNLGVEGLRKFKNMWTAIDARHFDQAAVEMLDSKWATQVGQRAQTLSRIMALGDYT
jgi:lysozyme